MKRPIEEDSDSENDEDYVPGKDDGGSSSGSEHSVNEGEPTETERKEEVKEKKDFNKVWETFQASVASQPTTNNEVKKEKLVKVVKKYRFAGEEHEEIIEVPETSEDANRWPQCVDTPSSSSTPVVIPPSERTSTSTSAAASLPPANPSTSSSLQPNLKPPQRKPPGPRKPKTTLPTLPTSYSTNKAKKITTLEKSTMDWTAHVQGSGQGSELEMNKKSGGSYLEKVEFLNRVDERKEELLDNAGSSMKRRKL
ncbi:hypothetical protein EST38_g2356 [Candolleomyces aberdarensis]|uniref:SWR1-complex protein 5 n=1 Tax=Candolleomyces aberdarensis TaxID=2316362 RepID=A0A4Q2DSP2_9AGAR|nr:hypothetical protein EST38_g2356 [Candolleomyces aberdarensis]